MVYVFDSKEKAAAIREKKLLLGLWLTGLAVVAAIVAALITVSVYMVNVHRNRSFTLLFGVICAVLTIGYACFSLFFFAIKFRLTRKYVRMLRDIDRGLKDTFEGRFLGYDDSLSMKDGVYFYTMILKTRPLRRDDIDERRLLVEHTVPKPEIEEGTKLKFISHANILVAYEIIEKSEKTEQTEKSEITEKTV